MMGPDCRRIDRIVIASLGPAVISAWMAAFILTLAIEVPIACAFLRHWEPDRLRLVLLTIFASLATHPLVWFVFPSLGLTYPGRTAAAEVWAVGVETIFYWAAFRGLPLTRAGAISIAANAASFLVGLAVGSWL
jgi:hypothetical protein